MNVFKEPSLASRESKKSVPDWLVGVWRRLSIEENGKRDTTTQVFWLQTHSCFGDIRIPENRPVVSSFDNLTAQEAIAIGEQDGFAGFTHLRNDFCHWHHTMDYHPNSEQTDIGQLSWEGDVLVEIGPDNSYKEEWQRVLTGSTAAMTLCDWAGWRGWLVACADQFVYMRSHPKALMSEVSMGLVCGGKQPWEIQLSTLPWKEGSCLWKPEDMLVDAERQQVRQNIAGRYVTWQIQELGELPQLLQSKSRQLMPLTFS